jgi:hypothetical protein
LTKGRRLRHSNEALLVIPVAVAITCYPGWIRAAAAVKPADTPPRAAGSNIPNDQVWKSETSGKEYRIHIEGNQLHAEWVNVPQEIAQSGGYIRTDCRRQGSKWIGKTKIYLPCAVGHGPILNHCHLVMGFEIDQLSPRRIAGRVEDPDRSQFDCKSCNAPKTIWKGFVWVPKGQ